MSRPVIALALVLATLTGCVGGLPPRVIYPSITLDETVTEDRTNWSSQSREMMKGPLDWMNGWRISWRLAPVSARVSFSLKRNGSVACVNTLTSVA